MYYLFQFKLLKRVKNSVWGDTLRTHLITGKLVRVHDYSQLFTIYFNNFVPIDSILVSLSQIKEMDYADPPFQAMSLVEPNDLLGGSTGNQWNLYKINAPSAWDITKGSSDIVVGMIEVSGAAGLDNGLPNRSLNEFTNTDGTSKFHPSKGDFFAGSASPHANQVASMIGAADNDGDGFASLGWDIRIAPYRITELIDGTSPNTFEEAINRAQADAVTIINCSFMTKEFVSGGSGCYIYQTRDYGSVRRGIYDALNTGIIIIAAAGNSIFDLIEGETCDPDEYEPDMHPYTPYPASYFFTDIQRGVVAISASTISDGFAYSDYQGQQYQYNHGSFVDFCAPGKNILTVAGSGSYPVESGTSLASPQVAALIGLMKTLNSNLTTSMIEDILKASVVDLGTTGKDSYFGYGRIDAYQALLLTHAYSNKSINYWASGYNNNHTIERGYFGKLHEVFHSGGEIFYRRSSNNGNSWEIPTRLSTGNGANEAPSIVAGVGSTDILCVTWQRKLSNYQYEIYTRFSSDMGTTWLATSSPMSVTVSWNQSNGNYGPGPTPVVASYYRSGYGDIPSYLLVYSASNSLYFRTSNTYNSGWSASNVIPGSSGSNSSIWFPSLASYNNQGYRINLIYDDRFFHVYSQVFNDNGTWSNRVIADWMGSYNRTSSIAIDNNSTMLGTWSGWNSTYSKYSIRFREGNAVNNTWSTYWKEWCFSSNHSYFPSLSYYNKGGAYPNGRVVIYHTDNNNIYRQKYSGSYSGDWTQEAITSNALFSNITHERSNTLTPKEIWTNQTSPYTIQFSSVSLPKGNALDSISFHRAAVIADKSINANLRIELSQPYIEYDDGERIFIPFKGYDYGAQYNLTIADLFDHLQTEKINIPSNAAKLKFNLFISSGQPDTLSDGAININNTTKFRGINFELLVKDGLNNSLLSNLSLQTLNNDKGIHNFSKSYEFNATTFRNKNIFIIPRVNINGPFRSEDLFLSMGNITISNESQLLKDSILTVQSTKIPKDYSLGQNYPNPFNPTTLINFSLPKESNVSLKIYDMLGKLVHTIFNGEVKSAGAYEVSFDARKLPSGVYFYALTSGDFIQTRKMILAK